MITEDYCSEEISKLLKESGFNWKCNSYYTSTGMVFNHFNCHYLADDEHDKVDILTQTLRPTHQMAVKWLRDKEIDITIMPIHPTKINPTKRYMWELGSKETHKRGIEDTYEEAVEAAILYYLTHTEVYERICS